MLIKLNRFYTTEEIIAEYRIPRELADKIVPHLPVFLTRQDGTKVHLESDVDEFLMAFVMKADSAHPPDRLLSSVQEAIPKKESEVLDINDINPKLNDREADIIEAIGDKTLIGEEVAKRAGYEYDSHFKGILSALVKRQLLVNNRPGYRRKS